MKIIDNQILSAFVCGADGTIGILFNIAGKLHADIYEATLKGDIKKANDLQEISR